MQVLLCVCVYSSQLKRDYSYNRGENTVIPVLTTALLTRHTGEDGDGPQHQQHSVLRLNRVKPHRTTNGHFFVLFVLVVRRLSACTDKGQSSAKKRWLADQRRQPPKVKHGGELVNPAAWPCFLSVSLPSLGADWTALPALHRGSPRPMHISLTSRR